MLALTKKTGYGIIALTYLAQRPEGLFSAREIAERFGVPMSLLMNVMKELSAAGYVESVRGAHGGYRLARSPEEINVADMVASLEGPIRLAECVLDPTEEEDGHTCKLMATCPISDPVHRIHRKLRDFLKNVTLADIVEPTAAQSAGEPSSPSPETEVPANVPEAADLS